MAEPLSDLAPVLGHNCRRNAAPDVELGFDCHLPGLDRCNEVFEDLVSDGLMKVPFVSIGPEVELEGLQLNDRRSGPVPDRERCEVGLSRSRAEAGEFGTDHGHFIVPLRIRVWNGLEFAAWLGAHGKRLPNQIGRCGQ